MLFIAESVTVFMRSNKREKTGLPLLHKLKWSRKHTRSARVNFFVRCFQPHPSGGDGVRTRRWRVVAKVGTEQRESTSVVTVSGRVT